MLLVEPKKIKKNIFNNGVASSSFDSSSVVRTLLMTLLALESSLPRGRKAPMLPSLAQLISSCGLLLLEEDTMYVEVISLILSLQNLAPFSALDPINLSL